MKRSGMKLLAVLALPLAVAGCSRSGAPAAPAVEAISPQEANAQVQRGAAVLVDVREKDEIEAGMAGPARWMALSSITANDGAFKEMLAQVPADRMAIFYCAAGHRAGIAARRAVELGHRAANMGGYSAWKTAGLPTRKP